ncbi:MAG: hypothetical protein KAJ75_03695 [Alphaproteobacteria bacterium]|nr:hypothetical protein [Alphaproteobacteria bacterium]
MSEGGRYKRVNGERILVEEPTRTKGSAQPEQKPTEKPTPKKPRKGKRK